METFSTLWEWNVIWDSDRDRYQIFLIFVIPYVECPMISATWLLSPFKVHSIIPAHIPFTKKFLETVCVIIICFRATQLETPIFMFQVLCCSWNSCLQSINNTRNRTTTRLISSLTIKNVVFLNSFLRFLLTKRLFTKTLYT